MGSQTPAPETRGCARRKAQPRADLPPQRTFQNLPHVCVVVLRQNQDHLWWRQRQRQKSAGFKVLRAGYRDTRTPAPDARSPPTSAAGPPPLGRPEPRSPRARAHSHSAGSCSSGRLWKRPIASRPAQKRPLDGDHTQPWTIASCGQGGARTAVVPVSTDRKGPGFRRRAWSHQRRGEHPGTRLGPHAGQGLCVLSLRPQSGG